MSDPVSLARGCHRLEGEQYTHPLLPPLRHLNHVVVPPPPAPQRRAHSQVEHLGLLLDSLAEELPRRINHVVEPRFEVGLVQREQGRPCRTFRASCLRGVVVPLSPAGGRGELPRAYGRAEEKCAHAWLVEPGRVALARLASGRDAFCARDGGRVVHLDLERAELAAPEVVLGVCHRV